MSGKGGLSPVYFAGLLVALVAVFFVAYRMGTRSEAKSAEVRISGVMAGERRLRQEASRCSSEVDALASNNRNLKSKEITELRTKKDVLNADVSDLSAKQTAKANEVEECKADAMLQKQKWTEADAKVGVAVRALTKEISDLRAQAESLQKGGMRFRLLKQALANARRRNFALRTELGLPEPGADYDQQLLKKHKLNGTAVNIESLADSMTEHEKARMADMLKNWRIFEYDAAKHPAVFQPKPLDDPKGTVERPKWFNRTGNAPMAVGTLSRRRAPITTTAYTLRALVGFGLCAMKTNTSNFTFPSQFFRYNETAKSLEALDQIVDTPLTTFCTRCPYLYGGPEFRLACRAYTNEGNYGSYDYWTARSLVRWAPSVYSAAVEQWKALGLEGKRVLSVALKSTPLLESRCRFIATRRPLRHYLYLKGNFKNRTLFEASASPAHQCQPSMEDARAAVVKLHEKNKYDAVFVTVERSETIAELRTADFGGLKVVSMAPQNAFEDAVDVVLSSMATETLLNRFADHSKVVAEEFQLRKQLKPDGIHFF